MNNYPALNQNRGVIFDPFQLDGGNLLSAVANPTSTLLGLGEPTVANMRTIKSPLPKLLGMADSVGLRFDLIVTSVPTGATVSSEGVPPAPKAGAVAAKVLAPVKRKLLFAPSSEESTAVPEIKLIPPMDAGYAAWLVVNHMLTPFGEAMLIVPTASWLTHIKNCPMYNRVWATENAGGFADPENRMLLYIARDFKRSAGPGVSLAPTAACRKTWLSNCTVYDSLTARANCITHFDVLRDQARRENGDLTDALPNVYLWEGKLRIRFSAFETLTGKFPTALIEDCNKFANRSLVDLAVMKDTRERVISILKNKSLRIGDDALKVFEDLCLQMKHMTAPFTRPSPTQRVAWLDENGTIACTNDFSTFKKGKTYHIETVVVTGRKKEIRHRPGFGSEEILVSGQELLLKLGDQPVGPDGSYEATTLEHFYHCFTQFALSAEMPEASDYEPQHQHTLSELTENFAMPDVLDIAEADPATYNKYVERLKKLQT